MQAGSLVETKIERKKKRKNFIGMDIEKIEIQLPLIWWKTKNEDAESLYGLKIKDSSDKVHYFNKDGTYDGWSMETDINEN